MIEWLVFLSPAFVCFIVSLLFMGLFYRTGYNKGYLDGHKDGLAYGVKGLASPKSLIPACPHGFIDWDNCPECCH
jgi:hypothetical protein